MITNVKHQTIKYDNRIQQKQNTVKVKLKADKKKYHDKTLHNIKKNMNDPIRLRKLEATLETGASSWLTALPLKEHWFSLNKQFFWDSLYLRYNLQLPHLPSKCICGATIPLINT